ncbi:uncharacterized protein LOC129048244 [Pongo abelii]|uniref:uncharacterized protein LOC129048244 n=1 Tax=Pongo abelii TaxID=9601 RepID=UPI0030051DDB
MPTITTPWLLPMFSQVPGALQSEGRKANKAFVFPFRVVSSPKAPHRSRSDFQNPGTTVKNLRSLPHVLLYCGKWHSYHKTQSFPLFLLLSKGRRASPYDHHHHTDRNTLHAMLLLPGDGGAVALPTQDSLSYLFSASFRDNELKPGTMSAYLIFGSYKGAFGVDSYKLVSWEGMIGGAFYSAMLLSSVFRHRGFQSSDAILHDVFPSGYMTFICQIPQ